MEHELTIKRELISTQLAAEYLRHNTHNRSIKNGVVKYYANQMKQGNWRCAAAATIVFDWNGVLQDGQHRLLAIIQSGCSIWLYVIRGADPDDFPVIDTGRTRGPSDTLALCQIKNAKLVSSAIKRFILINRKGVIGECAGTGIVAAEAHAFDGIISNQEILDTYYQNPAYWQNVTLLGQRFKKTKLLPPAFVSGLYAHLHLTKNNSEDTINGFFDGLRGESNESPIILLRDRIIEDLAKSRDRRMPAAYKHKLVAKAWNYYRKGMELKCLRVQPDENIDFD